MAYATACYSEPVNPPVESVTLELTAFEAEVLLALTAFIGGVSLERDAVVSISAALRAVFGIGCVEACHRMRDRITAEGNVYLDK